MLSFLLLRWTRNPFQRQIDIALKTRNFSFSSSPYNIETKISHLNIQSAKVNTI